MTGPAWDGKRILIVEDDDLNFEYLNAILEPTSIIIERAKDGVQAVDLCKKDAFDVVLMDIRIPKLDGLQATRKIRESGITIPVIAQTAFAMTNDRDKCLDAGCNDYISKPVNKDALIEVLSSTFPDNLIRHWSGEGRNDPKEMADIFPAGIPEDNAIFLCKNLYL